MSTKTIVKASPIDEVRGCLVQMGSQFKMALPPQIPVERFVRVAVTAIQQNSDLLSADRRSLYAACMRAAQDGLLPDGREAALVIFKGNVQYMPMVQGLCKKARNSGEIGSIDAQVVYENDEYESWTDEKGQHFRHRKGLKERGKPLLTYAYAITKDSGFYFEEVSEDQMQAIRGMSRAKDGPWNGPFADEMRRKSAIRRLAKYRLPSSADLDEVVRRDDDMYDLEKAGNPAEPPARPAGPSRLGKIIDAQAQPSPKDQAEDLRRQVAEAEAKAPEPASDAPKTVSEKQLKRFFALARESGKPMEEIRAKLAEHGWEHSDQITAEKYDELCAWAQVRSKKAANAPI